MIPELILKLSDLEELIKDRKSRIDCMDEEWETKINRLAYRIYQLTAKDRFDAGLSKEQWEELGEELGVKKIEMWEEDRGWIYSCGNCGKHTSKEKERCDECLAEFNQTERV